MMFLWIIGVVVIIYLVADTQWLDKLKGEDNSQEPLQILKERFAQGEITKEEFNQMKRELEE